MSWAFFWPVCLHSGPANFEPWTVEFFLVLRALGRVQGE